MQYLTAIIVSSALSASATWQIQNWRYAAKETEYETHRATMLEQQRLADTVQLERLSTVQKAAETRALALRRAADSARAESIGLRDALATLSRIPATNAEASTDRATAIGELLAECGDKYQALGAVADRHASDVKTLVEAWPEFR